MNKYQRAVLDTALTKSGMTEQEALDLLATDGPVAIRKLPGFGLKSLAALQSVSARKVIVTRHKGLVDYLAAKGIVGRVISHATPDDVKGNHVYGVLPLNLAALALSITTVDLDLPADLRGVELTREQCDQYCTGLTRYVVYRDNAQRC